MQSIQFPKHAYKQGDNRSQQFTIIFGKTIYLTQIGPWTPPPLPRCFFISGMVLTFFKLLNWLNCSFFGFASYKKLLLDTEYWILFILDLQFISSIHLKEKKPNFGWTPWYFTTRTQFELFLCVLMLNMSKAMVGFDRSTSTRERLKRLCKFSARQPPSHNLRLIICSWWNNSDWLLHWKTGISDELKFQVSCFVPLFIKITKIFEQIKGCFISVHSGWSRQ